MEISTLWKNKANQLEKLECAKAAILTKAKRPILNTYYKFVYSNHHEKSGQTDLQTRPLVEMLIASKNLFDGVWCVQVIMPFPLFRNMMIMACKDS